MFPPFATHFSTLLGSEYDRRCFTRMKDAHSAAAKLVQTARERWQALVNLVAAEDVWCRSSFIHIYDINIYTQHHTTHNLLIGSSLTAQADLPLDVRIDDTTMVVIPLQK